MLRSWLVFVFFSISHFVSAQNYHTFKNVGEECKLYDGREGICRILSDCDHRTRILGNHAGAQPCGFIEMEQLFCCEPTADRAEAACASYADEANLKTAEYVYGGIEASSGQFPHMVALYYPDSEKMGIMNPWSCGGSLISHTFVLTAAHCVERPTPSKIRVGSNDLTDDGGIGDPFESDIAEIIIHPKYNSVKSKYYDIALIRTTDYIVFGFHVFPACLQTKIVFDGSNLMVTGWGQALDRKLSYSNKLLYANVEDVRLDECNESWSKIMNNATARFNPLGVLPSQLCARAKAGSVGDTCSGDSGGPIQYLSGNLYYVVGITSYGMICGSQTPSFYSRVSTFAPWIQTFVWPAK